LAHPKAIKNAAKRQYELGRTLQEVAAYLLAQRGVEISTRTLRGWKKEERWLCKVDSLTIAELRVDELSRAASTGKVKDLNIYRELQEAVKIRDQLRQKKEKDELQKLRAKEGPKNKPQKLGRNNFSQVNLAKVEKPFFYLHQLNFLADPAEFRFYLKSRQVGLTFAIAWEALVRLIETGNNQIFISASRRQVGIIRQAIRIFSQKYLGVELRGTDEITVQLKDKGEASFVFLSTNAETAQGYHGDLYFDEFCWIPRLEDILETARPMAIQGNYRITYVSTPSVTSHASFQIWEGTDDKGKAITDAIHRVKITLDDAIKGGFDLISWDKIDRLGYSERQKDFLFRCGWLSDSGSLFKFDDLQACYFTKGTETKKGEWINEPAPLPDHNPAEGFPVDLGFDPNGGGEKGDRASLAALEDRGDRLRVIEAKSFGNQSINWQVAQIKKAVKRFKARSLTIDATGIGAQIINLLAGFSAELDWRFEVHPLVYSLESKWDLVFHVERLVAQKRLEWDGQHKEILQAFLAIKTGNTSTGRATIRADRKKGVGHADLFWALAHAASRSPVEGSKLSSRPKGVGFGITTGANGSAPLKTGTGGLVPGINLGLTSG